MKMGGCSESFAGRGENLSGRITLGLEPILWRSLSRPFLWLTIATDSRRFVAFAIAAAIGPGIGHRLSRCGHDFLCARSASRGAGHEYAFFQHR